MPPYDENGPVNPLPPEPTAEPAEAPMREESTSDGDAEQDGAAAPSGD